MTRASTSKRGILNTGAAPTHFSLERHSPAPDLAFFVERHWIVRWDLTGEPPFEQRLLPHPCVNMVIQAGQSAVHGIDAGIFSIVLEGRGEAVGTKFRPGAFRPFVDFDLVDLVDRALPLPEVFGDAADGLETRVLSATDDRARLDLVESVIRGCLPPEDDDVALAVRAAEVALGAPELTRVDDLADRLGVTVRQLQRVFRRNVGVSPKWMLRRYRLHEAADRAAAGTRVDWADLAAELGYTDQAHLVRDFKAQVGQTPAAYAAMCAAG